MSRHIIYQTSLMLVLCLALAGTVWSQERKELRLSPDDPVADMPVDTASLSVQADTVLLLSDMQPSPSRPERFVPNPARSVWMGLLIPGGGQIYNRKYWKLPIVYGGLVGCAYALSWNNNMYRDYSQAYLDIMDDDPNTKSYEDFLPRSANVEERKSYFQDLFKSRKDLYRRQRDLSLFCMIGVYVLSVIDAYVDAELSNFDITDDLSLRVEPTVFGHDSRRLSGKGSAVGLQCSLTF